MTLQVELGSAQRQLQELVAAVQRGDDVVVLSNHEPVARLVAVTPSKGARRAGSAKGKIQIADDFDAPLPELEEYTR